MRFLITTIAVIFLLIDNSFAQAPDTIWTKTYGDSSHDGSRSIIQASDESFIITGSIGTDFTGGGHTENIWVFNISPGGNIGTSNNFGGMNASTIIEADIDEFIIAAETFTQGSWENMEILKVNKNADTLWTKTYYFPYSESITSIKKKSNGGFFILGDIWSLGTGFILMNISETGDTLWTRLYSDIYRLSPASLELDDNGGTLFLVRKYDSTYIYKTDSLGILIWNKKICIPPFSASKFIRTEDGNYLLLGTNKTDSDSSFIWIALLNDNFESIWSRTYLSTKTYSRPSSIVKSNTGGYIVIGSESDDRFSQTDGIIMKINESGGIIWKKSYGGALDDYFREILILENNEFMVVGSTTSFGAGEDDAWVLKFSADTATTEIKNQYSSELPIKINLNQNYPNPFNPSTTIKFSLPSSGYATIKIFNVLGETVKVLLNNDLNADTYEVEWDASGLPNGIYFYQLRVHDPSTGSHKGQAGQSFVETKKMILLK